jgi:hypothetical protein
VDKHKKYKDLNRDKVKAQNMAQYYYPEAQKCSVTGCGLAGERHHLDYAYPLEIIWLCRKHHSRTHYPIKICWVKDCGRRVHAKNMCNRHYMNYLNSFKQTNCKIP